MNIRIIAGMISCAVLGVVAGYFLPKSTESAESQVEIDELFADNRIEDKGEESTIAALRERIKTLERALSELENMTAATPSEEVKIESPRRGRNRGGFNPREMMENLKKEDPERYAQITNQFETMRRNRERSRSVRVEFLKSIDESSMSAATKENHEKLLENTEKLAELEARIQDPNMPDEERGELFRQLRDLHETQRELNTKERENLIAQVSLEAGMNPEDAAEFSETIQDILDATNEFGGERRRGMRGGMPPPPMR